LGTFKQNIEKTESEKKELLERKIGGKKAKSAQPYHQMTFNLAELCKRMTFNFAEFFT